MNVYLCVSSHIASMLYFIYFFTDFKESLEGALAKGSVEVEIVKCVTLGPPEAGKTQLKSALVGRFDRSDQSTPMSTGAEVVMQRYISGKTSWEPLTKKKLQEAFLNTVETCPSEELSVSDNEISEFPGKYSSHPVNDTGVHSDSLQHTSTNTSLDMQTKTVALPPSPLLGTVDSSSHTGNSTEMPLASQKYMSIDTMSDIQAEKAVLQEQFHALRKSVEDGLKESEGATKAADRMSLQKVRMIHLIDSGGQPAFFDVHPVIATSRAVYLVVYNMKEGLEAKPKITYRKKDIDFPVKGMPNEMQSNLDMITGSLLTLQHCKQKFVKLERELHCWFGESISQSEDAVPVLVVGTRKTVRSVASESDKLAAACSHLPSWKEVLPCTLNGTRLFPVDSMDSTCEGIQALRDAITEAECTYQLRLPISWLFCQLIFWSAAENLQTLPFSILSDLCQHEGLVSGDRECLAMIRTFHLLGIFSFPYFDQEQTLGDLWKPDTHPVFTNPDVLYQQVTKVLEVAFHRLEITKMKPGKRKSLEELQSNGRLNVRTLHHLSIPNQLGAYIGFHSYLLERLVHWGLAARLASNISDEIEYFIPSVFPPCNQDPFCFPAECPIPDLAFTFKGTRGDNIPFYCVPLGIFPHLIVNILTLDKGYDIQHNTDNYKCLFRDAAIFVIKPLTCSTMEHSYNVRLTDNRDHISISILPSHNKMIRSDRDCRRIIRDFRSAIEDAYKRIYHTHHSVMLACPCPCGRIHKNHLAAILPHASQYIQECLSTEGPHWVQDCPEDIAAIVNHGRQ